MNIVDKSAGIHCVALICYAVHPGSSLNLQACLLFSVGHLKKKTKSGIEPGPSLLETGGSVLFLSAVFVYPGMGAGRSFTSLRGNEAEPGPRVWF